MPAALARKLFAAQQGDVVVDAMEDGHVVARLAEIREADLVAAAAELERAREELSAGMAVDIRPPNREALRDRYHVTVDEAIGRASVRERVCQYVWISLVAVSLKKKKK